MSLKVEPTPGELVIVTGMTGAGRSTAAKELEDLGYFVVDNLPPTLVRDVVRLVDDSRGDADVLLDTSNFNVHQLQDRITEMFGTATTTRLKVTVISFGFKYGIPVDADWVADMRFLPNPHWIPELRPQNGRDAEVSAYVLAQPKAGRFLEQYLPVLKTVAEGYLDEGKRFMQIAIGCTGGKHRSVAMTEEIAGLLRESGYDVSTAHRDLGRE